MTDRRMAFDPAGNEARILYLRQRGVETWGAERVFIGSDVNLDAIAPGVVLMNALVSGPATTIGAGSVVGSTGMARLHQACLGQEVELGAGSFEECVLFDFVRVRGFAEIRPGTVLEEHVRLGHNVGLKNSLLTCWTTSGSCINFCDVFVSGGTGQLDHSEIGSGAVHFNFSPRRDKFASRFGDLRGLLLRTKPVFIGGNSGIVAPCEIEAGQVVPAGTTLRQFEGPNKTPSRIAAGLRFIRLLDIIRCWYAYLRLPHAANPEVYLLNAAIEQVQKHRLTRVQELRRYAASRSAAEMLDSVPELSRSSFIDMIGSAFISRYAEARRHRDHIQAIQELPSELAGGVEAALTRACELRPNLG